MTGDAHVLRRLGKDITLSELEHMRNTEHMSNREIAQRLGTSYQTILNYLGPQRSKQAKQTPAAPKSEGKVWQKCQSLTQFVGSTHEFLVNLYRGSCEITRINPGAPLNRSEIHELVVQLTYIEQLMQRAEK